MPDHNYDEMLKEHDNEKHPQFVMSKYATKEDLYRAKADYYVSVVAKMETENRKRLLVPCELTEVDFDLKTVTVEAPDVVMAKGFHAGIVEINFAPVQ